MIAMLLPLGVGVQHDTTLRTSCASAASTLFKEHGVVVLERAATLDFVKRCSSLVARNEDEVNRLLREEGGEFSAGSAWAEVAHRSPLRYDIALGETAAVPGSAEESAVLIKDAPWTPVVESLLGSDALCIVQGAIVAAPGAAAQEPHRDGCTLFPGEASSPQLPAYCLSVFLPLIDVQLDNGPTEFLPGSHRLGQKGHTPQPVALTTTPGDAIIFDYRTTHRGQANRAATPRPVYYATYARPWFTDHINFAWHRSPRLSESLS